LLHISLAFLVAVAGPFYDCSARTQDCEDVLDYKWTAPARVLNFPANQSLGTLIIQRDWHNQGRTSPSTLLKAQGKVAVAKDMFVTLQANSAYFRNPQSLGQLPANAIDGIELKLMSMDDSEDELCNQALANMCNLKGLRVLVLDKSEVSDDGLKKIACLTNLEYISAFLTPLRGSFLKDLRTLKKLEALMMPSTGLKEDELRYLPEYPALQHLLMSHTNLSDKGMKYIGSCAQLKRLDVSRNPAITDQSIQYLQKLKSLQQLSVDGTAITFQGLQKLKGLNLNHLVLPEGQDSRKQGAQLQALFPKAIIYYRGRPKAVDDDTGVLYGQMSRQRHF
jgi:hypothetical protein